MIGAAIRAGYEAVLPQRTEAGTPEAKHFDDLARAIAGYEAEHLAY
jgi:hypothetical protein